MYREGTDVAAGKFQRCDGVAVRTHDHGAANGQHGSVVHATQNGVVKVADKDVRDEPLGSAASAAAVEKKLHVAFLERFAIEQICRPAPCSDPQVSRFRRNLSPQVNCGDAGEGDAAASLAVSAERVTDKERGDVSRPA